MNLFSKYDFILSECCFTFEINWNFNVLYLENYCKYNNIYIDSNLYLHFNEGLCIYIGGEEDYGNLLDLLNYLNDIKTKDVLIYESHIIKLEKKSNKVIIHFISNEIDNIELDMDVAFFEKINSIYTCIIEDYKKMAYHIYDIKKYLI